RLDLYQRAGERFLCELAGLLRITNQSQHGVEEAVLEVNDELPEGRAVARLRLAQKLNIFLLGTGIFRLRGTNTSLVMCSADARHGVGRCWRLKVPRRPTDSPRTSVPAAENQYATSSV